MEHHPPPSLTSTIISIFPFHLPMTHENELPLYIRLSQLFLGIVALFYVLYIGQEIIVPILFALIIAILLNPLVNLLNRKINRIVSITIAVTLATILTFGLLFFIGSQATMFSDSWPQLKIKFTEIIAQSIQWFASTFNISTSQIDTWIATTKAEGLSNTTSVIGQTLSTLGGIFVIIFLIPVYIFLFLLYKPLLLNFIAKLFTPGKHEAVVDVLNETKLLIQHYLVGLMLEFLMVSALNTIVLLLLGIEYALLIGVVGGLLNIIPYIGGVVAIAIPMLLAIATKEPIYAIYVLGGYTLVQLIDNNIINPMVVAAKVQINALVSIIVVLIGGALWGVSGMFLSLPVTAIIKVIFDKIKPLEPFGYLLGDTMPLINGSVFIFGKKAKKHHGFEEDTK